MRTQLHSLLVGASCALLPLPAFAQLDFLGGVSLSNGAEILSFDAASGSLLSTYSSQAGHGVQLYSLGSGGALNAGPTIDLGAAVGGTHYSLSSVVADSQGRGFGVALLIPGVSGINEDGDPGVIADSSRTGKAVFFSLSTGSVLSTVDVGYHPDSVTITPDGSRVVVANEGEYSLIAANPSLGLAQREGSLSIIDLSGVSDFSTVSNSNVTTKDFSSGNLGSGVSLAGLRNNDASLAIELQVEPEYVTVDNGKAYVSLQENNAVAVFDFASGQYTSIQSMGVITQTIDGSDRDDPDGAGPLTNSVNIDDPVKGLPMPDTVAKLVSGGTTYLVTANEGDARIDGGDEGRLRATTDRVDNGGGDAIFTGNADNATGIGRLNISQVDGNLDGDALIEDPHMFGTRSFSIVDPVTGQVMFDSGSMIEAYVRDNDIATFNIEEGLLGEFDGRSDNKGPEPEAIAVGVIDGRTYVFVGAERQGGVFQFDVTDVFTDPDSVDIVGYYNPVTGENGGGDYFAPESIVFLGAGDAGNATGKNLLFVGYEVSGSIAVLEVVTAAIPEPASAAAFAGLGVLGLAALRRRRES